MTYTIIIPVVHTLRDIEICWESLLHLDYPRERFQVAIVDCGIVPGLDDWWRVASAHADLNARLLTLPERSSQRFAWLTELRLNEARNLAVRECPADTFIVTEDDCSFEPDWLLKTDAHLGADVGLLSAPDLLPAEGMGAFQKALDALLNSPVGSPVRLRLKSVKNDSFTPVKDFFVVPADALQRAGGFPEELVFGSEGRLAAQLEALGYRLVFMTDNPVWHRRTTTWARFCLHNMALASEKTALAIQERRFTRSAHGLFFGACCLGLALLAAGIWVTPARILLLIALVLYGLTDAGLSLLAALRWRSPVTGLVHALLQPLHHVSVALGIARGVCLRDRAFLRRLPAEV